MRRRLFKTNAGLTLIEVLITFAILGIVISAIYSLNLFGIRSFAASNVTAENQFDVRMPTDYIAKKIRYADEIKILNTINPSPEEGTHQIYIEDGEIIYKDNNGAKVVIGTSSSDDYTFIVEKSGRGPNIVSYTIGKSGTNKYDLKTEVIGLNLKDAILGEATGKYIEFSTSHADAIEPVSIIDLVDPGLTYAVVGENIINPLRVTALMSDGTSRQVSVKWNTTKIDTSSHGYKTNTGRVVGTTDTVTFNVLVGDFNIVDIPDWTITTNKNEEFVMPTKVQAVINPISTTDEILLDIDVLGWNMTLDTATPGTYEAKGTALNYLDGDGNHIEFTMTLIVNDEPEISIISIDKIYQNILRGGSYTLPNDVTANMTDGTVKAFPVVWSPSSVNTSIVGTTNYYGTVSGFAGYAELELEVIHQKLVIESVIIQQSTGNNDNGVIRVRGNIGASVILKDSSGVILNPGTIIGSTGEVIINNVNTHSKHGVKTIMLTMSGWEKSNVWTVNP